MNSGLRYGFSLRLHILEVHVEKHFTS